MVEWVLVQDYPPPPSSDASPLQWCRPLRGDMYCTVYGTLSASHRSRKRLDLTNAPNHLTLPEKSGLHRGNSPFNTSGGPSQDCLFSFHHSGLVSGPSCPPGPMTAFLLGSQCLQQVSVDCSCLFLEACCFDRCSPGRRDAKSEGLKPNAQGVCCLFGTVLL